MWRYADVRIVDVQVTDVQIANVDAQRRYHPVKFAIVPSQ